MTGISEIHGDQQERFLRLWTKFERAVRLFVRSLLPPGAEIDDLMQEIATVLWRKFDSLEDDLGFLPWAFAVSRMEAANFRRKFARHRLVQSEVAYELLADAACEGHERRAAEQRRLEHCLAQLPEEDRRLVLSVHSPGESVAEIARQMGQKVRKLYSKVNRVRACLLKCMRVSAAGELT